MARLNSEFVSALGIAFEIFKILAEEVRSAGGDDSNLIRILKERDLRKEIVGLLVSNIALDVYPLDIRGCSIDDLVTQGRYSHAHLDINDQNFRSEEAHKSEIILKHFGRKVNQYFVLKALDAEGLRPATMVELLEFGIQYPTMQKQFSIMALGATWQHPCGDYTVACLHSIADTRSLTLYALYNTSWGEDFRFAAVRK